MQTSRRWSNSNLRAAIYFIQMLKSPGNWLKWSIRILIVSGKFVGIARQSWFCTIPKKKDLKKKRPPTIEQMLRCKTAHFTPKQYAIVATKVRDCVEQRGRINRKRNSLKFISRIIPLRLITANNQTIHNYTYFVLYSHFSTDRYYSQRSWRCETKIVKTSMRWHTWQCTTIYPIRPKWALVYRCIINWLRSTRKCKGYSTRKTQSDGVK